MLKLLLTILCIIVCACGRQDATEETKNRIPIYGAKIIGSDGLTEIGYSVNIVQGHIFAYIPDLDIYTLFNLKSGAFYYPHDVYYSERNCAGQAYIKTWYGPEGQSHVFKNSRHYILSSSNEYTSSAPVSIKSTFTNQCENGTTGIYGNVGTINEIGEPENLSRFAPMELEY